MHSNIAKLFDDLILSDAAARFGVHTDSGRRLGSHQSFVYGGRRTSAEDVVLRITHVSHRSRQWVDAELEWVEYLGGQGVPVARPLRSVRGLWSERVGTGGDFVASCFQLARGHPVGDDDLTPRLFETFGAVLGRMHRLSEHFIPAVHTVRRPKWYDLDTYDAFTFVPASQVRLRESVRAIINELATLPEHERTFGLIHADLHLGNVFIDGPTITCFDFDSCQYHWFGYDIAAFLFFTSRRVPREHLLGVLDSLLSGYSREHDTGRLLLRHLGLFLSLCEIAKYILYYKHGTAQAERKERRERIKAYRTDIEHRRPFLGLDWNAISS